MPIALDKSSVMHLGTNNLCRQHVQGSSTLFVVITCKDLGAEQVVEDCYYNNGYITSIVQKARRLVGLSTRAVSI